MQKYNVAQVRVKTSHFSNNKVYLNHFIFLWYLLLQRMSQLDGQNKGTVCIFLFINVVSRSLNNMNSLCSAPTSVTIFSLTPEQEQRDKTALCIHVLSFVFYGCPVMKTRAHAHEYTHTHTHACVGVKTRVPKPQNILSKRGFIHALCNTLEHIHAHSRTLLDHLASVNMA